MNNTPTPEELSILFNRILTLEILVSSIFDELVEKKLIEVENVDEKVQMNVDKLNEQIKKISNISDNLNLNMFMSGQVGEA